MNWAWIAIFLAAVPVLAQAQQTRDDHQLLDRLSWPVECVLGQTCFVQNYVDRAPGPEVVDVGCGPLSYEGHKGTDIALPSLAAFDAGVTVRAAAPGIVRGTRDGMEDILQGAPNAPDVADRECGNGVAVQQTDGLLVLYCHMKKDSVRVRKGQALQTGDPLGEIGLSGNTTFPHLHFELLKGDTPVDPFAPSPTSERCGPDAPLWAEDVPYVAGDFIAVGLTGDVPTYAQVKTGLPTPGRLSDPDQLIAWGYGYGARKGDVVQVDITGPEGVLLSEQVTQKKNRAQFYYYFGTRRGATGWAPGLYETRIRLLRDGQVIGRRATKTRVD